MNKTWMAGWVAATAMSCGGQSTCVAKGTRVSTPGGPRPVEDFAVGDPLLTVDPFPGKSAITLVTHILTSQRECGALSFGPRTLTVTSDHPLFDPDTRQFHPAGDWLTGSRSRLLAFDGESAHAVEVTARQLFVAVRQVFDLTVAHPWHTFVAEGLVVHNKSDGGVPLACQVPDGGLISAGAVSDQACSCTNGTRGVWSCDSAGISATCVQCGLSMGDAGP